MPPIWMVTDRSISWLEVAIRVPSVFSEELFVDGRLAATPVAAETKAGKRLSEDDLRTLLK